MTTIRDKRPEDVASLYAAWRSAVEATHDFLAPADLAAISTMVRDEYLPGAALRVVEDEQGQVIGFLGRTDDAIDALFVAPTAHGKGYGHALLRDAVQGLSTVRVDVNEQNASGRAFYARQGFQVVGRSERDGAGLPYPLLHLERREG